VTATLIQSAEDTWQVFDGDPDDPLNYVGTIREFDGLFRAYGTGLSLDFEVVRKESDDDFPSIDQAKSWLFDEPGTEA
jgi:hypothetical protein